MGFPGGASGKKNPLANADVRAGSIHGLGRSPGVGHGNPLQDFCLEKSRQEFIKISWGVQARVSSAWREELGKLQSIGLQRVRHNWSNLACICTDLSGGFPQRCVGQKSDSGESLSWCHLHFSFLELALQMRNFHIHLPFIWYCSPFQPPEPKALKAPSLLPSLTLSKEQPFVEWMNEWLKGWFLWMKSTHLQRTYLDIFWTYFKTVLKGKHYFSISCKKKFL